MAWPESASVMVTVTVTERVVHRRRVGPVGITATSHSGGMSDSDVPLTVRLAAAIVTIEGIMSHDSY
jgi:hypothetical protein